MVEVTSKAWETAPEAPEEWEPIRLAGAMLGANRHVCAFFDSREEEHRVLLPFIKEGIGRGENAFHIVDHELHDDHLRRLAEADVDVQIARKKRQLELRNWEETYFENGVGFHATSMIALVQSALDRGREKGFPLTRLVAHMEWSRQNRPGVDDLLEYETRFNLIPRHKDPVICTYDLSKFGADVIIDILRTHPMVILAGALQENPFFVPPGELLREIHDRKQRRPVLPS